LLLEPDLLGRILIVATSGPFVIPHLSVVKPLINRISLNVDQIKKDIF